MVVTSTLPLQSAVSDFIRVEIEIGDGIAADAIISRDMVVYGYLFIVGMVTALFLGLFTSGRQWMVAILLVGLCSGLSGYLNDDILVFFVTFFAHAIGALLQLGRRAYLTWRAGTPV